MPQMMIDTSVDSPKILRLTAQFLDDLAITIEQERAGGQRPTEPVLRDDAQLTPPAPRVDLDPAQIFGGGSTKVAESISDAVAALKANAPAAPPPPVSNVVSLVPAIPPAPGPRAPDEFDAAGMPYDNRIHSIKRTKVIAGTWKYLKGVNKDLIAAVEVENQARRQLPANATPPPPSTAQLPMMPPLPPPPPAMPPAVAPPPPAGSLPPAPPQAPQAPFAPPPPAQAPGVAQGQAQTQAAPPQALEFRTVMTKITAAMGAGKLTLDQMTPFLVSKGLAPKAIVAIGDRPDIWEECIAYVSQFG